MDKTLDGRFWVRKSEQNFLGKGRIELLLCIEATGSITKAAKMMKMSYRAAWDSVDIMNNLSDHPLVARVKGGKGGGGTVLTKYAKELVETYKVLNDEHEKFLDNLSKRINQGDGHFRLLESINVQVSARNQLKAKVLKIQKAAVESEVYLQLHEEDVFVAVVTNDSIDTLNLKENLEVYAIFKANAVIISRDKELRRSDRNRFVGKVSRISKGEFDAEVVMTLKCSNTICSTMSIELLEDLALEVGMEVVAFCKPKNIILGVW